MADQMMDVVHQHSSTKAPLTPSRRKIAGYLSHYVNQVQVTSSVFDIRLNLAEMIQEESGEMALDEVATIVMSPQHAKALFLLLGSNITRWEKQFGEISLGS